MYTLLAETTALVHFAYILFVIGGQLLLMIGWWRGWGWTRGLLFRLAHLAAMGFVVFEVWAGVACPLTVLENHFHARAGSSPYEAGFIAYWINELMYYTAPPWVFSLAYSLFFGLVLLTFIAYPPRRRSR